MNPHVEKVINETRDVQQKIEDVINNTPDADGDSQTASEPDPVNTALFHQITEGTIQILQSPEIEKSLVTIGENMNMDQESITSLINIIAIAMNNSAYQAILFYDDLLKAELTKQFDNIGHHINLGKADMEAFKSVLQIHQKQIGEIRTILKIDTIKKENEPS